MSSNTEDRASMFECRSLMTAISGIGSARLSSGARVLRFLDEHHGDVVADRITPATRRAHEPVLSLEPDLGPSIASRARQDLEEVVADHASPSGWKSLRIIAIEPAESSSVAGQRRATSRSKRTISVPRRTTE